MTGKKTLSSSILGLSGSLLSSLGVGAAACCAGPGAAVCGTVCAPVCGSAIASILGVSSSALASWASSLLPVFVAISAIAFTSGYYKLYGDKKRADCDTDSKNESCCDTNNASTNEAPSKFNKIIFWGGLVLTLLFYAYTFAQNSQKEIVENFSETHLTELADSNALASDTIPPKTSCCKAKASKSCCSAKAKKNCSPRR